MNHNRTRLNQCNGAVGSSNSIMVEPIELLNHNIEVSLVRPPVQFFKYCFMIKFLKLHRILTCILILTNNFPFMQIHKDLLESHDICNCEGKKLLIKLIFCSFKKEKNTQFGENMQVSLMRLYDFFIWIFRVINFSGFGTYGTRVHS